MYAVQAPSLAPYAHWQAHPGPVLELAAVGEGVMSLSHRRCVRPCLARGLRASRAGASVARRASPRSRVLATSWQGRTGG